MNKKNIINPLKFVLVTALPTPVIWLATRNVEGRDGCGYVCGLTLLATGRRDDFEYDGNGRGAENNRPHI